MRMNWTRTLNRRSFLSWAGATASSVALSRFGFATSGQATGLSGKVELNSLVYPGFDPAHPSIAVFGAGRSGTEAVRLLPSVWQEDMKWGPSTLAPSSIHEFVTDAMENFRSQSKGHRREQNPSHPSWLDSGPMAIVCCAFDDEPAFNRTTTLAKVLTSHSVPTVMVGLPRDELLTPGAGPPNSYGIELGSLRNFRLFRIVGPPSASNKVDGPAMAAAASVFVDFFWSASLIGASLCDFYGQIFRTMPAQPGMFVKTNGRPIIAGKDPIGIADPAFRTDRSAVITVTLPKDPSPRLFRETTIDRLRDLQWPHHRWTLVYLSIGMYPDFQGWDKQVLQIIEIFDCREDDPIVAVTRSPTGGPDRLTLQLLAAQLPDPEATAV